MEKTVEMKPVKAKKVQEEKKLSYEDLEKVAQQLSVQCQQLSQRLQQRDLEMTFKRLDYLFEVLKSAERFPEDFLLGCIDEIIDIMTPITEEEKPE